MQLSQPRYIGEAHQSILDLRSPTLQDDDLSGSIRETAERIVEHKRMRLNFAVSGSGPQPVWRVHQELVRIAHEAVSNAVRHSGPTCIEVEVSFDPESVRLRVTDDGCGFEPEETTSQKGPHWGLPIMRERAEQIGATLTIRSAAGCGTTVDVVARINREDVR